MGLAASELLAVSKHLRMSGSLSELIERAELVAVTVALVVRIMLGSSLSSPDDEDEDDDSDDVSSDEDTESSSFPPLGLPSMSSTSIRSSYCCSI
jgi:hypothetical protein